MDISFTKTTVRTFCLVFFFRFTLGLGSCDVSRFGKESEGDVVCVSKYKRHIRVCVFFIVGGRHDPNPHRNDQASVQVFCTPSLPLKDKTNKIVLEEMSPVLYKTAASLLQEVQHKRYQRKRSFRQREETNTHNLEEDT